MNVIDVNPEFAEDILLETLLTTQVKNLHGVSHLKHETFTVLQYAKDFCTIVKESTKRTSRWAAKYYTHDRSYYPVPQSAVPLSPVATMAPLPSEGITPGVEEQIKEWLESYRPYRQRTVRSEITKDKADALPPAVYTVQSGTSLTRDFDSLREFRDTTSCQKKIVNDGDVSEMFERITDAN